MAGGYYKKIVSYCELNDIQMPRKFHDTDPSKFVLLRQDQEGNSSIYWKTFDYEKAVIDHFKYVKDSLENNTILNFKNDYIYEPDLNGKLIKTHKFQNLENI